jgi:hypothetical protein
MQSRVHLNWLCKSLFFHDRFQLPKLCGNANRRTQRIIFSWQSLWK